MKEPDQREAEEKRRFYQLDQVEFKAMELGKVYVSPDTHQGKFFVYEGPGEDMDEVPSQTVTIYKTLDEALESIKTGKVEQT